MIDALITGLSKGLELSAEEIADTLWLALQIEESQPELSVRAELRENPPQPSLEQGEPEVLPEISTHPSEQEETASNQPPDEPKAGIYPRNPQESLVGSGLSLRVPDAPSLREPLTLARALKPLMRRMPSGSTLVLDEAATTQQIAETGLWLPVLKPTLEPWLDLELVVDEGISMQIWRHTIGELERLLKNYGIFRDVRVWGLIADDSEASDLPRLVQIRRGIGATAKHQSPRSPAELIDPSGRRLILVVSDCVSPQWRDGKLTKTLELWAKQGSMAIVQMLPKWLWKRTALGRASEVRLQGLNPGEFNQKLIAKGVSLWDELEETRGVKVPIFTLEPERVATWAQMLSGKGSTWTAGYVFKLDPIPARQGKDLFNLDVDRSNPEQRVQAFRVTASPMARKLAGLLAAAPVISLPIVRLIQETLLKESQQVHVAEVFLGGLLKPLSEINPETNPNYVQYEFIDGVRELLADSVPSGYVLDVVDAVSKYVARKLGLSLAEFAAVLQNPQEIRNSETADNVSYFATMTAQVLRRLGGEYTKFAESIRRAHQSQQDSTTTAIMAIGGAEDKVNSRLILRTFIARSRGSEARIAIIPSASQTPREIGARYHDIFAEMGAKSIEMIDIRDREQGAGSKWQAYIETCTGVFITGGDQIRLRDLLVGTPIWERILIRVKRGEITLAGTSAGTAAFGHYMISGGTSGESPHGSLVDLEPGLGIFPEAIWDQHFHNRNRMARLISAIAAYPDQLGIGIDEDTCAVLDKNGCFQVIGRGSVTIIDPAEVSYTNYHTIAETNPISIHNLRVHILTHGDRYDSGQRLIVSTKNEGNPTELATSVANFSLRTEYQSQQDSTTTAIMAIGGAEDKVNSRLILRTFIARSRGSEARIAIIPSASQEPTVVSERYRGIFAEMGTKSIEIIDIRQRDEGADSNWQAYIETCTGVFITGGDQLRFRDLLVETPIWERILMRAKRGEITLAGTSSGMAVFGQYMISGGSSGESPNSSLVDLATGLGIFPEAIWDQHFHNRNRMARLISAIAAYPDRLGIGIDEDTCAVLEKDGCFQVIGTGSVTVIDPAEVSYNNYHTTTETKPISIRNLRVHILTHGDRYDLTARKAVYSDDDHRHQLKVKSEQADKILDKMFNI
jgi:cyanophycinase